MPYIEVYVDEDTIVSAAREIQNMNLESLESADICFLREFFDDQISVYRDAHDLSGAAQMERFRDIFREMNCT